jgi:hypothetical protein
MEDQSGEDLSQRTVLTAPGLGAADRNQPGMDGQTLPAHGGGHRNRDTRTSRLRANYPKERRSTELLGLGFKAYL